MLRLLGGAAALLVASLPASAAAELRIDEVWPDGPAPFVELLVVEPTQTDGFEVEFVPVGVSVREPVRVPLEALTRGRGARIVLTTASAETFERVWGVAPDVAEVGEVAFDPAAGDVRLVRDDADVDGFAWGPPEGLLLDNLVRRGAVLDPADEAWRLTGVATPGAPNEGVAGLFVVEGQVRTARFAADAVRVLDAEGTVLARTDVVGGVYRTPGIPPSAEARTVALTLVDGSAWEASVTLDERNARADFVLDRLATLDVELRTPSAEGRALIVEIDGPASRRVVDVTDRAVRFEEVPTGTWTVRAEAFGYELWEERVVVDGPTEVVDELVPLASAPVRVHAVLRTGQDAVTAQVRLEGRGARGTDPPFEAVAGAGGRVEFADVPVGDYRLTATYLGGETVVDRVRVAGPTELTVSVLPRNFAPPSRLESGCAAAPTSGSGGAWWMLLGLVLPGLRRRRA